MYQPGMISDRQLAQVRYAEVLEEAAQERASRKAQSAAPKPAGRRMALVLAGVAPVVVWVAWMWTGY